jgi:hypothetical protein
MEIFELPEAKQDKYLIMDEQTLPKLKLMMREQLQKLFLAKVIIPSTKKCMKH